MIDSIRSGARRQAGGLRRRALAALAGAHRHVGADEVALTFDDGPDPDVTPRVLDVLRDCDAVATFFVVGERARAHPALIERMASDGHAVGTHSFSHRDLSKLPTRSTRTELREGRDAVEKILGVPTHLVRPPHGRLGVRSAALLRSGSWTTWLWTVDTYDWKRGATSTAVATEGLRAGGGAVLLLHDTCAPAVEATRTIVAGLRERDLRLVTL